MAYDTKQRRLVEDFLKENKNMHFSAEDVYYGLINAGGKIGRTTVYRQLDRLSKDGNAKKFFTGDNDAFCYQYIDGEECANHYHLKCTKCGKLFHMQCDFIDRMAEHIYNDHKFTVEKTKIVIYGLCEDCAKEENK